MVLSWFNLAISYHPTYKWISPTLLHVHSKLPMASGTHHRAGLGTIRTRLSMNQYISVYGWHNIWCNNVQHLVEQICGWNSLKFQPWTLLAVPKKAEQRPNFIPCLAQTRWERQQTLAQSGVLICQQLHLLTLHTKISTKAGRSQLQLCWCSPQQLHFLWLVPIWIPVYMWSTCKQVPCLHQFRFNPSRSWIAGTEGYRPPKPGASLHLPGRENAMVALAHLICWVWIVGARYSKSISTEWLILLSEHCWNSKPIRDIPSKGMFCCLPTHPSVSNMNSKPRY